MLTKKQKQILDFVKKYSAKKGFAPALEEIKKHFRLRSVATIHQHIATLRDKGYLHHQKNQPRSITASETERLIQIPVLGRISAGQPIEAIEDKETIAIPQGKLPLPLKDYYALRVQGDSMVDEGILNEDIVVIKKQQTAENGETVVALLDNYEVTLKKIYREKNGFRLQPANPKFKPIFTRELTVQGKVVSIIRSFDELKDKISKREFTNATIEYLEKADMAYRKLLGQYFTPRSIRDLLISKLPVNIESPKVLDPGCGTGEFLITAKQYFKNPELHGWDIYQNLIGVSKRNVPEAKLKNIDALENENYEQYDFVIGNTPYFEFTPTEMVRKKFKEIIGGRVNIFSLFIYQGIKWLKEGGYLAYIVPPSMNNGAYFSALREFVVKNANIEYLHILNDSKIFAGALQSTMLLVLKKGKNKGDYIFKKNNILIFSKNHRHLTNAFKKKKTLYDLGYSVKTGRLVWNQNRNLLTDNSKEGVPLVWAHNITDDGLKVPTLKAGKPQYVKTNNYDTGPCIVVNRITGSVRSTKLKAGIIPAGMKFIAENHVNVIFPPTRHNSLSMEKLATQLTSKEKIEVLKNITGNTQISKTELERLLPISV